MIVMDRFDVTMRQAADLGAATFLLRAFVDGNPDEFVRRRAAAWVAEHSMADPTMYDDNPLDDDEDEPFGHDDDECEPPARFRRPGSRVLYAEGLL